MQRWLCKSNAAPVMIMKATHEPNKNKKMVQAMASAARLPNTLSTCTSLATTCVD